MVESLKLSITDQQLPMFIRILELIIALYYGEIGAHKEGEGEEGSGLVRDVGAILPGEWGLLGRAVTILSLTNFFCLCFVFNLLLSKKLWVALFYLECFQ